MVHWPKSGPRDIIVTWPKSRPLASYLAELENARTDGRVICYRVRLLPGRKPERCYRVHDGHIRGWTAIKDMQYMDAWRVRRVGADPSTGYWPAGNYVICDPEWHELGFRSAKTVKAGFRGWHWFDRTSVEP